jgi:hypothetical protein
LVEHRRFEPSNEHMSNKPTEQKDLQREVANCYPAAQAIALSIYTTVSGQREMEIRPLR